MSQLIVYIPASILHKSIAGCYRPVSYPDGPITARYKFMQNAYWGFVLLLLCLVGRVLHIDRLAMCVSVSVGVGKWAWGFCQAFNMCACLSLIFTVRLRKPYIIGYPERIFLPELADAQAVPRPRCGKIHFFI